MRDLKECQAEVFLRSEKRIKARKKRRNRILMTCIPMALGLTVAAAALWPEAPAGSTPEKETCALFSGSMVNGTAGSVVKVDVVGHNTVLSHVETADILKITDFLDSCTAPKPESTPMDTPMAPESDQEEPEENATVAGGRGEEPAAPGDNYASGGTGELPESGNKHSTTGGLLDQFDASLTADLTVILTAHDGTQTQYTLRGNRLTDLTHNKTYVLTPAQVTEFRSLLGVAQP